MRVTGPNENTNWDRYFCFASFIWLQKRATFFCLLFPIAVSKTNKWTGARAVELHFRLIETELEIDVRCLDEQCASKLLPLNSWPTVKIMSIYQMTRICNDEIWFRAIDARVSQGLLETTSQVAVSSDLMRPWAVGGCLLACIIINMIIRDCHLNRFHSLMWRTSLKRLRNSSGCWAIVVFTIKTFTLVHCLAWKKG